MEEQEDEPNGFIDPPLDTAIRGFQRDKGLRVDGFMRPDGPTERSLQHDLRGLLSRERGAFGSTRGDGLGSLGRGQDRFGSGEPFEPALAFRGDDREARLDEGRTLALGLDDPPGGRDRAPKVRGGGAFSLLELGSGRSGAHALQARPEQDRGGARTVQPRDEEVVGASRSFPTTAEEKPSEPEPARLTPFLDKAESNLRRTIMGWRTEGLTDAARHLEHFLEGSGDPITYNRDQARSFSPVRNAEQEAHQRLGVEIAKQLATLGRGGKLTATSRGGHALGRHALEVVRGFFGNSDLMNDNIAVGRTTIEATFDGTAQRLNDDVIAVDGIVTNRWREPYDFRGTTGLEIPQVGADAALALQRHRGARDFEIRSDWKQRVTGRLRREGDRWTQDLDFEDLDFEDLDFEDLD